MTEEQNKSIHSQNISEIHEIPLKYVYKPVQPMLDETKVSEMMEILKVCLLYIG